MKFSLCSRETTYGKFVQWMYERQSGTAADEWKTVGANGQCPAVKQKIVYFKYWRKTSKKISHSRLPISRNRESLRKYIPTCSIVKPSSENCQWNDILSESILILFPLNPTLFRVRLRYAIKTSAHRESKAISTRCKRHESKLLFKFRSVKSRESSLLSARSVNGLVGRGKIS